MGDKERREKIMKYDCDLPARISERFAEKEKDIHSKEYARESCDICSNRFDCVKVVEYDKDKEHNDLRGCSCFDDVFAK